MTDFEKNAKAYMDGLKAKQNKQLPAKDVVIPFLSVANSTKQVLLNPALDASVLDAKTATAADYKVYPLLNTDGVITADGLQTEMIRRPAKGEKCVIDWISVTMQAYTFENAKTSEQPHERLRQSALIDNVSDVMKDIFGFGIDVENKSGRNFYERSYTLEHKAGFVCIGGQNDTIMISINGTGCTYGKEGWEGHFNAWLGLYCHEPKITRIDLAHDDLYGEYTNIDWFNDQHTIGGFTNGGRPPAVEWRGDWKKPNGKGRSLYIGSRDSSKFTRIYEKGRQLGDKDSAWLRTEVEYKSRDIFIPLDVLINPSQYFLASYPCFHVFDGQTDVSKFERIEKQNLMTFDQAIEILKNQYGRYLHFFRQVYDDDNALLDVLTDIKNKAVPERIDPLTIPKLSH